MVFKGEECTVKTAESDELEEHADYSCKVPGHAVDVWDRRLHDLRDVGERGSPSLKRPELGTSFSTISGEF
jgi:hypothetical protein